MEGKINPNLLTLTTFLKLRGIIFDWKIALTSSVSGGFMVS